MIIADFDRWPKCFSVVSLPIGFCAGVFLPQIVRAQVICQHVAGCSASNAALNLIPALGNLFLIVAGGGAVAFIVVGGGMMLLSFGDDSRIARGRMAVVHALLGLALIFASQVIVSFVGQRTDDIAGAVENPILSFLSLAVDAGLGLLNIAVIFVVMFAGFRMIISAGRQEEVNKGRVILVWAVVGTLVINLASALVRALVNVGL